MCANDDPTVPNGSPRRIFANSEPRHLTRARPRARREAAVSGTTSRECRVRRFAIAVVVGAVLAAGCSSSGKQSRDDHDDTTMTSAGSTTTAAPTTTRTAPVTPTTAPTHAITVAAPSVSASFVSPRQGFALERNGQIDATTDGGHTWHRVGQPRAVGRRARSIRFIDPSDGFAFQRLQRRAVRSRTTAARPGSSSPRRSPTSPTSRSSAARSTSSRCTPGAPSTSGSGRRRWRISCGSRTRSRSRSAPGRCRRCRSSSRGARAGSSTSNRTVIAGARLRHRTAGGRAGRRPAQAFGGDAGLAASTSTDLVASLQPGPGTPASLAMTSRIEFSHDGGTTFASRTIPNAKFGAGGPLSPSPDAAVIVDAGDLRRTTDGGATWHGRGDGDRQQRRRRLRVHDVDPGLRHPRERRDAHDVRRRRDLDASDAAVSSSASSNSAAPTASSTIRRV